MRYKAKAWEKNHKKWYDRVLVGCDSDGMDYVCHLVYDDSMSDWVHFDKFSGTVVMWTGLRDKNGKEIYEGDVIIGEDLLPSVIIFYNGSFRSEKAAGALDETMEFYGNIEIIGNIYENPELVGEQP